MKPKINWKIQYCRIIAEVKQKYIEAAATTSCDWWNFRNFEIIKDVVT
jgi:hypothetical protein